MSRCVHSFQAHKIHAQHNRWTALHWAAQTNPPKQAVAEALLKFPGIEVNVKGKKG